MTAPKLRFKEFDGCWVKSTLSQVAKVYDGTHQTPNYVDQGIKFISVENIDAPYASDKFITKEAFEKDFKNKPQVGDILMTRITAGVIGATALVHDKEPLAYYVSLALIRPKENLYTPFLNQYISTPFFKRELHKRIIHVAFPKKINLGDINECKVVFSPLKNEQTKIASFLSSVDEKISQITQKHALLNQYKQGMMQKLFSQQIRFKADDGSEFGEWESKTLGDVADIVGGGTPSTNNEEYWNGNVAWLTPSEINKKFIGGSKRTISEFGVQKSSAKKLPIGTVLFTSRATIGEVAISTAQVTTNQGFQSFIVNSKILNEFLYYWIVKNKQQFIERASGSTFLEISKSKIQPMKILLPCIEEQTKIANFLSAIDQKIEVAAQQIEQAKQWKKGLLQQMFV